MYKNSLFIQKRFGEFWVSSRHYGRREKVNSNNWMKRYQPINQIRSLSMNNMNYENSNNTNEKNAVNDGGTSRSVNSTSETRKIKRNIEILITFDCFGTLYTPHPPVNMQYSSFVHEKTGIQVSPDVVGKQMKGAFKYMYKKFPNYGKSIEETQKKESDQQQQEEEQQQVSSTINQDISCNSRTASSSILETTIKQPITFYQTSSSQKEKELKTVREWWSSIIRMSFHPHELRESVVHDLYHHFNTGDAYIVYPDVIPALDQLFALSHSLKAETSKKEINTDSEYEDDIVSNVNIRFGVITNSDPRVFDILSSLGLLHTYFDPEEVYMSYDLGYGKPDPRIFQFVEESHIRKVMKEQQKQQQSNKQATVLATANSGIANDSDTGHGNTNINTNVNVSVSANASASASASASIASVNGKVTAKTATDKVLFSQSDNKLWSKITVNHNEDVNLGGDKNLNKSWSGYVKKKKKSFFFVVLFFLFLSYKHYHKVY